MGAGTPSSLSTRTCGGLESLSVEATPATALCKAPGIWRSPRGGPLTFGSDARARRSCRYCRRLSPLVINGTRVFSGSSPWMSPPGDLSFHPDPPPADVRDHGEDLAALHHFVVVHTVRPLIRHAGAIVHDHATVGWSWRDVGMHVPIAVDARPRLECAALGGPALAGGESRDRQPEQKCAKREATHEGQAVDGLFASPGRRDRYRVLRNFPRATATIRFCTRHR